MNDTWEWDGMKWEMKNEEGPLPRNGPAMAYDSTRKKIVLNAISSVSETDLYSS